MSLNLGIIASSRASAAPPVGLLLDTYPGAAAAYSLRKLRTAYAGSAIRVRRSSDNTETDIGFVSDVLDTSTLLTFCGVGTGTVIIWYDQSGNARNLTTDLSISRPRIVISGVLQLFGTKPAIYLQNSRIINTSFTINQPNSFFNVTQGTTGNNTGTRSINESTNPLGTQRNLTYKTSGGFYAMFGGLNLVSSTAYTTIKTLITTIFNTTASSFYLNSSAIISNQNVGTQSMLGISIGSYSPAEQNWDGYFAENIVYNSNQTSNRTGIESNINTYYSIY